MSAGTITMILTRLLSEWAAREHVPIMLAVSACVGFVAGMIVIYLILRRPFFVKVSLACAAAALAVLAAFKLAPAGVSAPSLWQAASEQSAAACTSLWTAVEDAHAASPRYLCDLASTARQYMNM